MYSDPFLKDSDKKQAIDIVWFEEYYAVSSGIEWDMG